MCPVFVLVHLVGSLFHSSVRYNRPLTQLTYDNIVLESTVLSVNARQDFLIVMCVKTVIGMRFISRGKSRNVQSSFVSVNVGNTTFYGGTVLRNVHLFI